MRQVFSNKIVLSIIAILLLANIAMLVFYIWFREPVRRDQSSGSRATIARFLEEEIGFSQDQIKQFHALRDQQREKMKPLFEDVRVTKIAYFRLLSESSPADSTITELARQIGKKQENIELQTFQNFRAVRSLCSPQQQTKYDALIPGVINKMWFTPKKDSGHGREKRRN